MGRWWWFSLHLVIGWDDDCPGLTATLAREAEWVRREEHNEAVDAEMEKAYESGWPGVRLADYSYPSDEGPLGPDGWPDLSLPPSTGVQVTIEVHLTVEEVEGHSACRLLMSIVRLSVPDLLSFLYHSTVGTSFGSCAPCRPHSRFN
jgi:hypothetical protein